MGMLDTFYAVGKKIDDPRFGMPLVVRIFSTCWEPLCSSEGGGRNNQMRDGRHGSTGVGGGASRPCYSTGMLRVSGKGIEYNTKKCFKNRATCRLCAH